MERKKEGEYYVYKGRQEPVEPKSKEKEEEENRVPIIEESAKFYHKDKGPEIKYVELGQDIRKQEIKSRGKKNWGFFCMVFACIVIVVYIVHRNYNEKYEKLKNAYKESQQKLQSVEEIMVNMPEKVAYASNVCNENKEGEKIGEIDKVEDMRFLRVDFIVHAMKPLAEEQKNYYIDIYNPNGSLWSYSTGLEDGHTMKEENKQMLKDGMEDNLSFGIGNGDQSIFKPGKYRIVVYYGEEIIGGKSITLR